MNYEDFDGDDAAGEYEYEEYRAFKVWFREEYPDIDLEDLTKQQEYAYLERYREEFENDESWQDARR